MADGKFRQQSKFLNDAIWNYGAFAVMAASGVILNFFIAAHFGIEALGVFNQIYALYVVTAQFAVLGFHDSAQKHVSELDAEPHHIGVVSAAALVLAAGFGLLTAFGVYFLSQPIGFLADSEAVGKGIALAAPGLVFFAINKVLMGILNGVRRMKAFAGAQALRVSVILLSCLGVAWIEQPAFMLGLSFTIAEVVLLPFLLYLIRPHPTDFSSGEALRRWIKVHFHFGSRALINGFLAESYIRIDIIMLGIFMSDRDVGIYSFAALFIEGLFQVPVVFRTLANPELARLLKAGDKQASAKFCRKVALMSLGVFGVAAAIVLFVYPYLGPWFPDDLVNLSYPLLLVLIGGLTVYAVMIPTDMIVLQAGMPGRQSLLMTFNVLVNAVLNLALIPLFGLYGAASATAIAFVVASVAINGATWKWLGFKGGVLLYRNPE
ncbi:MAG: oligosaccharide flippase family protein [Rhodospirillaceae bacterium]|nr:oligosaccharide flippase family protein [Rhodospirillaceae bacterium]MBL6940772.1 oligosaccharide flippase family protein [Rhodospirillales bacterium]